MTTPTIRFNAALRASKVRAIPQLPEAASNLTPSALSASNELAPW